MSHDKFKIMKVYGIKDENGNIWKEEIAFDKYDLVRNFICGWLCRCPKIDSNSAWRIWVDSFVKNGWQIVELEIIEKSNENELSKEKGN